MTTNNAVDSPLSGTTGTGNFVGSTSPTITTPAIIGVTDGSSAAAGRVGEIISNSVFSGSAVSLTSGANVNICSIVLTPGDWVFGGNFYVTNNGSSALTQVFGWINNVSASAPDRSLINISGSFDQPFTGGPVFLMPVSINTNTTYYLTCNAVFSTGTASASGNFYAQRIR